jgi:predicted nucleic acid-binding protein
MSGRYFIDTNVCLYGFGTNAAKKDVTSVLFAGGAVMSVQVLNEMARTMLVKWRMEAARVREAVGYLSSKCEVIDLSASETISALDIFERYRFSWWDSLIIASGLKSNCAALYTEDLQHDQIIDGKLKVINPFIG